MSYRLGQPGPGQGAAFLDNQIGVWSQTDRSAMKMSASLTVQQQGHRSSGYITTVTLDAKRRKGQTCSGGGESRGCFNIWKNAVDGLAPARTADRYNLLSTQNGLSSVKSDAKQMRKVMVHILSFTRQMTPV